MIMSSKHSKNDGSCLGYFIIIAFVYYVYDKYGISILNFLKKSAKIIFIIILIWVTLFILYKIIKIIYNYISHKKNTPPESIALNTCDSISEKKEVFTPIQNNPSDFLFPTVPPELLSDELDFYFTEAAYSVLKKEKASVGMIQRSCKIGFNRAEKILNQLEIAGIVGPEIGTQPRQVLMSYKEFQKALNNGLFAKLCIPDNLKTCLSTFESPVVASNDKRFKYYNDKFDYMNGYDFEEYCAHLLHDVGFSDITITPASNDFGVDILAKYNGVLYAFQCKRYSSNVGVHAVHEITGGMNYYHAKVGVVITNQYYTNQAQELATEIGIQLWDRDFLQKLIDGSINGSDLISLIFASKRSF